MAIKATDTQILAAYSEGKSVWRAAKILGMCGQSVHERLVKLNANNHTRHFTAAEEDRLRRDYNSFANDGRIAELAKELGRNHTFVARHARRLGLTNRRRPKPYLVEATSLSRKEWYKHNPHPRGMLGKTHSEETLERLRNQVVSEATKEKLSDASCRRWASMTKEQRAIQSGRATASWKSGWREIGGRRIFARSRWEANYARYLEWLVSLGEIASWEHEPQVFWFLDIKRGTRSYLPDFSVTENNGSVAYHEVKGWMDPKSATKIKRMAKYHPDVKLIVIGSKNYRALQNMVARMIPGWEVSR